MTHTIWQTLTGFIMTALLLATFNSGSLQTWSFDLEPGPVADVISVYCERWHALMVDHGPAGITEAVRLWFSDTTGAF